MNFEFNKIVISHAIPKNAGKTFTYVDFYIPNTVFIY